MAVTGDTDIITMNPFSVIRADLSDPGHQDAILEMMNAYASDPMGDGRQLSDFARGHLIDGLRNHPTSLVFLAIDSAPATSPTPLGIATCFGGFSTFAAKPLINVSDFFVSPGHRGRGIGRAILERVEQEARQTGCCKITLEVQENNSRARSIYEAFGLRQAVFVEAAGGALCLSKPLAG